MLFGPGTGLNTHRIFNSLNASLLCLSTMGILGMVGGILLVKLKFLIVTMDRCLWASCSFFSLTIKVFFKNPSWKAGKIVG